MKTEHGSLHRKLTHAGNGARVAILLDPPTHQEIARLAWQIYQDCGCPEGRDLEFWLEAERQLTPHG